MKMSFLYASIALILAATPSYSASNFLITCSKNVRPGMPLSINVNILSAEGAQVTASLVLNNRRDRTESVVGDPASASFEGGTGGMLELQIPDGIDNGDYYTQYSLKVHAEGNGVVASYNEESTQDLNIITKKQSVFIQTDKAKYKPGDTVKFRTFAVDMELRPLTLPLTIKISDPANNAIAQWLDETPAGGLFSGSMELSDYVNEGDWKIEVTVEGSTEPTKKMITVEEYVLPKFEVTVVLPPFVVLQAGTPISVSVKAEYTYGQPVGGVAALKVSDSRGAFKIYPDLRLDEEGIAKVEMNIEQLCQLQALPSTGRYSYNSQCNSDTNIPRSWSSYSFEANVTETVTGTMLSGESQLKLSEYGTEMEFTDATPLSYKQGFPFTAYVSVTQPDKRPPQATQSPIEVNFTAVVNCKNDYDMGWGMAPSPAPSPGPAGPPSSTPACVDIRMTRQTQLVPTDGQLEFTISMAEVTAQHDSVQLTVLLTDPVTNKDVQKIKVIDGFKSKSNEAVVVTQRGGSVTLSAEDTVTFDVQTAGLTENIYYQMYGKGELVARDIIKADVSSVSGLATTQHEFTMTLTTDLAKKLSPTARLIVSYITESGELVADTLQIQVNGALTNQVSVGFSETEVRPGTEVSVQGTAHAGSQVALLAVDQSVLLLAKGNDIDKEAVLADYAQYDPVQGGGGGGCMWWRGGRRKKRSMMMPCFNFNSGTSAKELFEKNQVLVFTDAMVYEHPAPNYPYYPRGGPRGAPGGAVGGAVGPAFNARAPGPMGAPGMPGPQMEATDIGPSNNVDAAPDRLREIFEETWIFNDVSSGSDGTFSVDGLRAPDSITSWVLSAFALHDTQGLGIADIAEMNVFQPFFVSLTLPYSVVRGEKFALKVTVFNYMTSIQEVTVTLSRSDDFRVSTDGGLADHKEMMMKARVKPNGAQTVVFWLSPLTLGMVDIDVRGSSSQASDALRKQILVKAEGETVETSVSEMVIRSSGALATSERFVPVFPEDAIEDTKRVYFTAVGNLLGSAMSNLDALLKMPTGCGEQNMLNFAPDVFITQYLTQAQQTDDPIMEKALKYMRQGYQRELTYRHDDSSFSAFGNRDDSGSTWLTAFVVRTFHQALEFLPALTEDSIKPSLNWLISKKQRNGAFQKVGTVHHERMTGGASEGVGLSAYVTLALLECRSMLDSEDDLNTAVAYLEGQLGNIESDMYALAITTYALVLADSRQAERAMNLLNNMATEQGGMKFWSESPKPEQDDDKGRPWYYYDPPSLDVEMTAYAMLASLEFYDDPISAAIPIARWLTSKQNKNGGYSSTQDTVVGLHALTQYVMHTSGQAGEQNLDVQIHYTRPSTDSHNFQTISLDNQAILQMIELEVVPDLITLSATGSGTAIVQMTIEYNVLRTTPADNINLNVDILDVDNNNVQIESCVSWTSTDSESGMAIVSVESLSGYAHNEVSKDLVRQYADKGLKMVEMKGNALNLYLDQFTSEEICVRTRQKRQNAVLDIQESKVAAYSYYSPEVKRVNSYLPPQLASLTVCDACPDCPGCDGSVVPEELCLTGATCGAGTAYQTTAVLLSTLLLSALILLILH